MPIAWLVKNKIVFFSLIYLLIHPKLYNLFFIISNTNKSHICEIFMYFIVNFFAYFNKNEKSDFKTLYIFQIRFL